MRYLKELPEVLQDPQGDLFKRVGEVQTQQHSKLKVKVG